MDQQPLPKEVLDLLSVLQSGTYAVRMSVVERLGKLNVSYPAVVSALLAAQKLDVSDDVRKLAAVALQKPVHQEILQKNPDLTPKFPDLQSTPILQSEKPVSTTPPSQLHSEPAQQRPVSIPTNYAPYRDTNKYSALRSIASLCNLLSYVVIGIAGISVLVSFIKMVSKGGLFLGFGGIAVTVVFGGISFLLLRIMGESISVLLDIESNTRKSASLLEQRLR
jgi:hypothetical protein